jgi:hypothetical protein
MSTSERTTPDRPTVELAELPRFELSYLFDDERAPSEVTVFPASDDFDISTNWITVGVDGAVPLDDVR